MSRQNHGPYKCPLCSKRAVWVGRAEDTEPWIAICGFCDKVWDYVTAQPFYGTYLMIVSDGSMAYTLGTVEQSAATLASLVNKTKDSAKTIDGRPRR